MRFNCGPKSIWIPILLVSGLVCVFLPFFTRRAAVSTAPDPIGKAPSPAAAPAPATAPAAPTFPGPPTSSDPLLRQWQTAIRVHDAKGVMNAQSAFLAREEEFREPLMKMAKEDGDARIRSFSVTILGRMKTPPPESFFVERLDDSSEYPRTSALQALEKIGTAACLPKVERLASSDGAEGVRAAAAQAAKAVRSR